MDFEQFVWRKSRRRGGGRRFETAQTRALGAEAQGIAFRFGHNVVRPVHVLLATMPPAGGRLASQFLQHGVDLARMAESLSSTAATSVPEDGSQSLQQLRSRDIAFSNWAVKLIRHAGAKRGGGSREPIDLVHGLAALLQLGYEPMRSVVMESGVSEEVLQSITMEGDSENRNWRGEGGGVGE